MSFLADYGYIGLFFVVSVVFALTTVLIPQILTALGVIPSKPSPAKSATYECGMDTIGKSWVQFNFRYYFLALLFLVFDIETVFLYPWAVAFNKLGLFGFVEMVIFVGILVVAYLYAWKKKAFEWK
ncbi:MAG: NADH-quinone oxidoreductase subunit A [Chloroflexi bacterium]|nr:NADH-quinone oxidoreductase subunit A [Chloroflexota bacterium]